MDTTQGQEGGSAHCSLLYESEVKGVDILIVSIREFRDNVYK